MTEGYIKFNCKWEQTEIQMPDEIFRQLETVRSKLYQLGLIGMYPDSIGYGNISSRSGTSDKFYITGSATGHFAQLSPSHYALVKSFDFKLNSIHCAGLIKASAESLSHAAIYQSLPQVGAVIHIHSDELWTKYLNNLPTTSVEIEYGTPEMAFAIIELISEIGKNQKIIIMGGHREGILSFGEHLQEALNNILQIININKND